MQSAQTVARPHFLNPILAQIAVLSLIGTLIVPSSTFAVTDGAFGLVSQGSTDISIIRGDTAQASGLWPRRHRARPLDRG